MQSDNNSLQNIQQAIEAVAAVLSAGLGSVYPVVAYVEKTSSSTATTTIAAVSGLELSIVVPKGGQRYEIECGSPALYNTTNDTRCELTIWDGAVGSGTQITFAWSGDNETYDANSAIAKRVYTLSEGAHTIRVGLKADNAGTANFWGSATGPAYLLIKPVA